MSEPAFPVFKVVPKKPPPDFVTEDTVARLFAERFSGRLLYCHSTPAWLKFDGAIWRRQKTPVAFHWARELAQEVAAERKVKERARAAMSRTNFASGVERFAQADPIFARTAENWDLDPYLFATPGGTVDLRSGALLPADPAHGITKAAAVTPAAEASCPIWLAFLQQTFGGDAGLIRFIQQWCGYSLTGDTTEHAMLYGHGGGLNGKSVLLNTTSRIMGDYAVAAAMDVFTAAKFDKHPTDLAMLRGARLVTASETEEGRAWAEARIKQLTGGDAVTARFMHRDNFTFRPTFKLTIVGNHKPILHNVDEAARRRFNIVPFAFKPANPDPDLEHKLEAEWPAILRWMIDGCLDWQANRLVRPDVVRAATDAYFSEQDLFGQWIEDECIVDIGNPYRTSSSGELYGSWKRYAERAGDPSGSQKAFSAQMQRRGFEFHRGSKGVRQWRGIELPPTDFRPDMGDG